MQIGVSEAAERLGVSDRRVRAMLESGILDGEKVGARWLVKFIEHDGVRKAPVRPLSSRSCWVIFNWADAKLPEDSSFRISAVEKHRLKDRIEKLSHASDPLPLVRAWFAHRAEPRRLRASSDDLADLRADRRLVLSGVSHPEAGLLAGNEVEGYVSAADLQDLVDDYLLVEPRPDSPANVVLHVLSGSEGLRERDVPPLALAADLAERPGVREQNAARDLIRRALADQSS